MKKTISFILCATLLISALIAVPANAGGYEFRTYRASLIEKGFPYDYADKLAALHERHPSWSFEPINVTEMSGGEYTWDHCVYMETDANVKRSLVHNSSPYVNWRHPSNQQFDSGWWRASVETVKHFMDPRNFFDDEQIFQFYDLKWNDSITLDAVKAVVRGTFMENKKLDGKYSDITYAEFFYQIGKELDVSPVYLAARVRAEQGTAGTSPLINGNVGDMLWYYYSNKMTGKDSAGHIINAPTSGYTEANLKSYNGYYNYFNIGSAGTGYFEIYKNGITEAKKGTPDKKDEWGGDASWNMHWKSIYGGAYSATNKYVNDYQNTPYFQKFNVDPRSSRNFWGQYMQSILGSVGMATQSYNTFKENNMIDLPYTFLIPVYNGMPDYTPHPDVLASGVSPALVNTYVDERSFDNGVFSLLGWVGYNFEMNRLGYSIDGGETVWEDVRLIPLDLSVKEDVGVVNAAGSKAQRYRAEITDPLLSQPGAHTIMIKAELNGKTRVTLDVFRDGPVTVSTVDNGEARITNHCIDRENDSASGRELSYFTENDAAWYIKGWFGVNRDVKNIGFSIDGKTPVYGRYITAVRDESLDPYTAGGKGYRFEGEIKTSYLEPGEHTLEIYVVTDGGDTAALNALRGEAIEMVKTKDAVKTHVPGDINCDTEVNNKDIVALFNFVSGSNVFADYEAADVSGDGTVNNKDIVLLFRYVNGGADEIQ